VRTSDAVLVAKFGHLGLKGGTWPVIGRLDEWDRGDWPTPVFVRFEELTGRTYRVFYDDANPNRVLGEEPTERSDLERLPGDGLYGAGAVERKLTTLLG
jgi:hypothetical protein